MAKIIRIADDAIKVQTTLTTDEIIRVKKLDPNRLLAFDQHGEAVYAVNVDIKGSFNPNSVVFPYDKKEFTVLIPSGMDNEQLEDFVLKFSMCFPGIEAAVKDFARVVDELTTGILEDARNTRMGCEITDEEVCWERPAEPGEYEEESPEHIVQSNTYETVEDEKAPAPGKRKLFGGKQ